MPFLIQLLYQFSVVSILEAQEVCGQTNRMSKQPQTQAFSFILNDSHGLLQTPESWGLV